MQTQLAKAKNPDVEINTDASKIDGGQFYLRSLELKSKKLNDKEKQQVPIIS
jgi:hypothetical protein